MNHSIWFDDITIPAFPSLKHNMKTEVLIIGGGIAGILTAYFLHQKNIPYVLLEKNQIGRGTTGNTSAKITIQHGLIYSKLEKSHGKENSARYLQANQAALNQYRSLCSSIDCDFETKSNYVFERNNRQTLEDELRTLERIGHPASFAEQLPLPFSTAGAVCFPSQAQFHPLKFLSAIAKELNIYENSFVRQVSGTIAVTDDAKVQAKHIIITTHFPFLDNHGCYFLKLYQHRSYVIALENAQNVNGMYVDAAEKGFSFRNQKELLLLGGGDHRTGKTGGNYTCLRKLANRAYPQAKETNYWATQDCMSLDGMPYIGKYSKNSPSWYTASGFNKWGMTGSMLSAMLLSDLVTGTKNEYTNLFSPSRSILRKQLFLNGMETGKNLLTVTGKRCPHLGCALKWNPVEHSYDCACHGSRFDESGKVLDNPANGNLPQK